MNREQLLEQKKKIDFICTHFDPFQGETSEEVKEHLKDLSIDLEGVDPFQFTKILMQRLHQIEEKLTQ